MTLPRVELTRTFTFEAAHYLPRVPTDHKCSRMHGHSFHLTVTAAGLLDPDTGWVFDFADIKDIVQPFITMFDHHLLNDYIDNPTCENILVWLWDKLAMPGLTELRLSETGTSWATYRGQR